MSTRTGIIITSSGSDPQQRPTWDDADLQTFLRDFIQSGGVFDTGDNLKVEELATPANKIQVKAGIAYIEITKNSKTYKVRLENFGTQEITVPANSSGNPRIDRIIAKVDVATEPNVDASNIGTLELVEGTPAGSPVAPDTPANAISLATVAVANGQTVFEDSDITDDREIAVVPARFLESDIAISQITGLQTSLDGKEPSFSKNTGFNLNKASQAQAEAGTVDTVVMTPLRVKDALQSSLNKSLGSWSSQSSGAAHQATTDGFVCGFLSIPSTANARFIAYSDSSSSPTTIRQRGESDNGGAVSLPIMFPVKKDDYWKVDVALTGGSGSPSATLFWIPFS